MLWLGNEKGPNSDLSDETKMKRKVSKYFSKRREEWLEEIKDLILGLLIFIVYFLAFSFFKN